MVLVPAASFPVFWGNAICLCPSLVTGNEKPGLASCLLAQGREGGGSSAEISLNLLLLMRDQLNTGNWTRSNCREG